MHNCKVLCILNVDVSESRLNGAGLLMAWLLKLASISIIPKDPAKVSAIVQRHYVVLGCSVDYNLSKKTHCTEGVDVTIFFSFIILCKG